MPSERERERDLAFMLLHDLPAYLYALLRPPKRGPISAPLPTLAGPGRRPDKRSAFSSDAGVGGEKCLSHET